MGEFWHRLPYYVKRRKFSLRVFALLGYKRAMSNQCDKCGGRGTILTGREAKNLRKSRDKTLDEVSRKMGISLSFLGDLESGRRSWTAELEAKLMGALK